MFVDWLVSDETCCLDYFENFLRVLVEAPGSVLPILLRSKPPQPSLFSIGHSQHRASQTGQNASFKTASHDLALDSFPANPFRTAMFKGRISPDHGARSSEGLDQSSATALSALVEYSDSSSDEDDQDENIRMSGLSLAERAGAARQQESVTFGSVKMDSGQPTASAPRIKEAGGHLPILTALQEQHILCKCSVTADNVMTFIARLQLLVERLDQQSLLPFSATNLVSLLAVVEMYFEEQDKLSLQ